MANELEAAKVSRNPLVIERFESDPLVHHVATPRWFTEVRATQARIRGAAADLAVPTLMVLAEGDKIVDNEASLAFARAAASVVEVRRHAALYHELFLEPEWPAVVSDIAHWLCSPLQSHDAPTSRAL
jgi:alpha-beta hydrolase superfamily lysophospholipase